MPVTIRGIIKKFIIYPWRRMVAPIRRKTLPRRFVKFYSKFIKKGDLCFDVGAHIGNRTETFLKLGASVISVEPQEHCLEVLRKKFRNNLRVTIIAKGLAEKEGKLPFYVCNDVDVISTFYVDFQSGRYSKQKWDEPIFLQVTTLDNLVKKFGTPKFCKIDVEGYELQVLKGLTQPIPNISIEFHYEFMNDTLSCIKYLNSLGDAKFNISLRETLRFHLIKWVSAEKIIKRLRSFNDPTIWGDVYAKVK